MWYFMSQASCILFVCSRTFILLVLKCMYMYMFWLFIKCGFIVCEYIASNTIMKKITPLATTNWTDVKEYYYVNIIAPRVLQCFFRAHDEFIVCFFISVYGALP